jgi:hypothetical protein
MKQIEKHLWVEKNLGGLKGNLKELEKIEEEEL